MINKKFNNYPREPCESIILSYNMYYLTFNVQGFRVSFSSKGSKPDWSGHTCQYNIMAADSTLAICRWGKPKPPGAYIL